MPSRPTRKRQTRLAFTPLPSSSPAAKDYHKQIQERAAAVVLEDSPSANKRRKVQDMIAKEKTITTIPTPPLDEAADGDERPLRPTQRRRTRQQPLSFSSARDPTSFDSPVQLVSSPRRSKSKAGMFSSQMGSRSGQDSDSDASDVVVPASQRRSRKRSLEVLTKRVTRNHSLPVVEEDEESDSVAIGIARPRPTVVELSDDEDDDMPTTLGNLKRQRKRRSSLGSFVDDSSPPRLPKQTPRRRKKESETIGSPPDSPPAAIESDDDLIIVDGPSRKHPRVTSSDDGDHDEGDEDELATTPERSSRQRKKRAQEKNDLDEDLEYLKPSSEEEEGPRVPRSTQSTKKTAQQKALEKLKEKRTQSSQVRAAQSSQVGTGHSSGPTALDEKEYDEDDEGDEDEHAEQSPSVADDEDGGSEIEEVPQRASRRDMFREDEYDAEFIEEEDEDGLLGAEDIPKDIPIEFTRYASMKSKELFKYAVEWFVQRKINPAFSRNDSLFRLTFQKLDDEVQGLKSSKFTSSAWIADFIIALEARPEIQYRSINREAPEHMWRDKCEACNRSGHPPTYVLQFAGPVYNRETLDEVVDHNDDDDDDSSDDGNEFGRPPHTEYDVQHRAVPPATTEFYVGKFCKANAESAHELHHWRHALAACVEEYLEKAGHLTDKLIAKRDKMSTHKRGKKAMKMVDEMERAGEIKQLWSMFRKNIDDARNSKQNGRW